MQAITSGEIHKNQFYNETSIKEFLSNERKIIESFINKSNTLYNKNTIISDPALNYFNTTKNCDLNDCLRNMVIQEYYDCEKIYPYLGDYFLFSFFNLKIKNSQKKIFSKKEEFSFLKTIKNPEIKSFCNWLFNNANIKKSVFVKEYLGNEIAVEVTNDFTFDVNYDYDYYEKLHNKIVKDYKVVVIDGFIESVGEIHHLLVKANKSMIPYVIFCYGLSEEVKFNILKNNREGRIKVYPVCLDSNDENSLNLLNDFCLIQNTGVISSNLGQTISQAVREELASCKKITFLKNKILIEPCVDKITIESHRNFLKTRINEAKSDVNIKPIENRLKMFSAEKINLYLPKRVSNNKKSQRELDYFLRFLSHLRKTMVVTSFSEQKVYIPCDYINIAKEKAKSLKEKMNNVKVIIIDRS